VTSKKCLKIRKMVRKVRTPQGDGFGDIVKYSFASGLGFMGSVVVYMFIGMLFLIPGIYLVMKEHKKPKEKRSTGMQILGVILIAIGCVIGLGMGSSFLGMGISDLAEA
jgi:uncharacterized membrane protein HdeD (DUF308 family)